MDKKVILHDYAGRPVEITIPDVESVTLVLLHVISGDMTLSVFYADGTREDFDSQSPADVRHIGFADGLSTVPIDKLDALSTIVDSTLALEWLQKREDR